MDLKYVDMVKGRRNLWKDYYNNRECRSIYLNGNSVSSWKTNLIRIGVASNDRNRYKQVREPHYSRGVSHIPNVIYNN